MEKLFLFKKAQKGGFPFAKRTLVTSALPYANGPLHIGHIAGAYLPADIYTRYKRLRGEDVIHVCGTDEHGVAITIAAEKEGISPQSLVDRYYKEIKEDFEGLSIDFDFFSRTSIPLHHKNAQEFFLRLYEKGYVVKKSISQFFCPKCQRFLPDRYVVGTCPHCSHKRARGDQCENCGRWLEPTDLISPRCSICGTEPILKETYHYYFKLDQFSEKLEKWLSSKKHQWKENVLGLALSWVREGLRERAITRDLPWGVKVPLKEAEGKVLYVWFDAPIGYITATQEWANFKGDNELWKKYWMDKDTRLIHFIGKDNIVFHALVWPAMLMAHGDFILPDNIPANEFLNLMGDKISTSRGWALWVHEALDFFPADYIRFGIASILPESKDSDFDLYDFQNRIHSELADNLGNFIHRTLGFIKNYLQAKIPSPPEPTDPERELFERFKDHTQRLTRSLEDFRFREALKELLEISREGNRYFDKKRPWVTRKEDLTETKRTLATSVALLRSLVTFMEPFLPNSARRLQRQIQMESIPTWQDAMEPKYLQERELGEIEVLFAKIPDSKIEALIGRIRERTESKTPKEEKRVENISFDEFKRMDLRIGKVLEVENIEGAKKLYKLRVDLGDREITLVAGLKEFYTEDDLKGKEIVVIANLEPATIRGIKSEGMLLAAVEDGKPVLLIPEKEVPPGTKIS